MANGVFKYVERELLERNWIDREDLIFTWKRTTYEDGTSNETPIMGSHTEAYGALQDLIDVLKANTP